MTINARAVRATATIPVMIVAVIAGLVSVLYGLWVVDEAFSTSYYLSAPVAAPLELVPLVQGTIGESMVQYATVNISSDEPLLVPRVLGAASHGLYFLLFILACVSVVMLCVRLLRGRSFTRMARWSMFVIGGVTFVTSIAAPYLASLSGQRAAQMLGFPTDAEQVVGPIEEAEWIVPHIFTLQDTNWALAALGVLLVLVAATFVRGERMQRDTEGLV